MTVRTAFINARLVDPATGLDTPGALLVEDGHIADMGPRLFNDAKPQGATIIDCAGAVLAPGLIDMRVFTGEPGAEHRETLASAGDSAAAGGVTSFVMMPVTDPVIDDAALVDFIRRRAAATSKVNILPAAALTMLGGAALGAAIGAMRAILALVSMSPYRPFWPAPPEWRACRTSGRAPFPKERRPPFRSIGP